ncbi:FadR family transcriptional regulator [Halomonas sp. MCCC 1A17488]|uniref:FadR/GntR family transcriptional regulator n=1 Tax=unclassified Halomonas TaxID=2609666 RepID=UPI0018D215CB|nr:MULTISPECIES: FadR/GntR family transcriptional regulator [unclassified Halomonas]MCE8016232.1 FadR family transcriptional regulator [Halomonas sp. MCCC 1A17488]MCG3239565.1 FadR family transcriptional regulator [Halomonas sp. MCCC 1A17488]QPP50517.1 FadR family transcriptional regulator [Halomonas sp. SS10-MC5]
MSLKRQPAQPLSPIESFGSSIDRSSVALQLLERIKGALIRGELQPGDYLPSESELTHSLGIGKSSVREAIKMLQAIGIVEVRRGQGTLIRREPGDPLVDPMAFGMILARGMTRDVLEFRKMFEPAYTLQAMSNAWPEDHVRIQQTIDAMESAIANGEQTARHDVAFHRAILRATHNPMTIRVGETLIQLIEAALETSMQTQPEVALKDHKAIYAAFQAGDEEGVKAAIETSSVSWETNLTYPDGS